MISIEAGEESVKESDQTNVSDQNDAQQALGSYEVLSELRTRRKKNKPVRVILEKVEKAGAE